MSFRCSNALLVLAAASAFAQKPLQPPEDVRTPPANAATTKSGIAIRTLTTGTGTTHPQPQDCVDVRYTMWKPDGKVIGSSGIRNETVRQCLVAMMPGVSEVLQHLTVGQKVRAWIPAELTYTKEDETGKDVKGGPLTIDIELVNLISTPAVPANLTAPPPNALKTPSGVSIAVLRKGTGKTHPTAASTVTVHFTGWTAAGTLFESTVTSGHPATVLLGTALHGWREALPRMVAGEKARIWIPAALAYGETAPQRALPSGNLVYDIELISFTNRTSTPSH